MKYHEILKALIGIPSLSARLDNPFPLVGDKVTISSTSEWVRQHEYLLDGGAGLNGLSWIVYWENPQRL